MPEITPNQDFLHGGTRYEKDKPYQVSSEEAYYFRMCGWVGGEPKASSESVTLDIHDSKLGHKSEV